MLNNRSRDIPKDAARARTVFIDIYFKTSKEQYFEGICALLLSPAMVCSAILPHGVYLFRETRPTEMSWLVGLGIKVRNLPAVQTAQQWMNMINVR